MHKDIL